MLVCVMCVLMLCSLAGCGNNTGTANDNLNDATSGENYDGSGEKMVIIPEIMRETRMEIVS